MLLRNETYYFLKRVPYDLKDYYSVKRLCFSLKTKSYSSALRITKSVLQRLEDYWLGIRLQKMDIPAIHLVKSENKNDDGEVIHRGISQRQFARSFTIADDVKVNGAELTDGLLTVACERILPDHKKKRLIEIK